MNRPPLPRLALQRKPPQGTRGELARGSKLRQKTLSSITSRSPTLAPPLSGGEPVGGKSTTTPSPDKGRAGEGFRSAQQSPKFHPYAKHLTAYARTNRKEPTPAENLLWQKVLRNRQFHGYKFLRQKPIGPYIADFYCAELNLVIEIDGDSHAEQAQYDAERSVFLASQGVHVLRYANRDILGNLPGIYEHLQTQLKTP